MSDALKDATNWIQARMPSWDKTLKMSLFGNPADSVDGLGDGIASEGIKASLQAKADYPWAWNISKEDWYDYNLPYANVDEPRNHWRPFLKSKAEPLIANLDLNNAKISNVVYAVNNGIWKALGTPQNPIVFKSSQTPLIYDPFSTITYGYASCTGISITFVDALRSIGVCARVVGTPAWHNHESEGNHNWTEILYENQNGGYQWGILEGKPAQNNSETVDNPCDKWFCKPSHFGTGSASSQVFASRWDNTQDDTKYPMSWNTVNQEVPGVDRSAYYNEVCAQCGKIQNKEEKTISMLDE